LGLVGATLIGLSAVLNASEPAGPSNAASPAARLTARPQAELEVDTGLDDQNRSLPTLTPTVLKHSTVQVEVKPPTVTPIPTAPIILTRTNVSVPIDVQTIMQADETVPSGTLVTDTTVVTELAVTTSELDQVKVSAAGSDESQDSALDAIVEAAERSATNSEYVEPYTSTDQVLPPPSAARELEAALAASCPTTSEASFDLIPIEGQPRSDHPDFLHADLNLSLRGYRLISETLQLEFYNGATDPDAPQLHGLYEPNRLPIIRAVYQINNWIWDAQQCGGNPRGCRGAPVDDFWPVTMVGLATVPGDPIYLPERRSQIYGGGFTSMVLYADERQIALGYTRRDSVSAGYTIHLQNICVDANLLALYRSQKSSGGWRASGFLPAVRNNQALGIAAGREIVVAVRDVGSFMDPRSQKDWWK
jgi:hypothetical protein